MAYVTTLRMVASLILVLLVVPLYVVGTILHHVFDAVTDTALWLLPEHIRSIVMTRTGRWTP